MKAIELVEGLKEFTGFCIENPNFEVHLDCICAFRDTPKEMAEAIKTVGKGEKSSTGDSTYDYVEFRRMFGQIKLRVLISHDKICERIVTVEEVPEKILPAKPATEEMIIPAHTVEKVSWKCPKSILEMAIEDRPGA